MKWTCVMITLDGAEYLWYAIKSIYDFIKDSKGNIIIIEGSTQYAYWAGKDGNSSDDTKKIIDGFIKDSEPGFIIHKRYGRVKNKIELRNKYMDEIHRLPKEQKPDWCLILDDDELYKKEDLERLDKFLKGHKDIVYVFNDQRFFWKDFNHVLINDELQLRLRKMLGTRNDKVFYDMIGSRLRQGQYHERIFKFEMDLFYKKSHSTVTDGKERDVYIDPFYEKNRIMYGGCPRYHYGYITTKEKMERRFFYYQQRDCGMSLDEVREKRDVWTDNYGWYLLYGEPRNPLSLVKPFYGLHPEIIKQHPYFKKGNCPMVDEAKKKLKEICGEKVIEMEKEKNVN